MTLWSRRLCWQLCSTITLFCVGDLGDYVESTQFITSAPILHAIVDNFFHTIIGAFSWLIVSPEPWTMTSDLVTVMLGASLIDLDHFLAAGSIHVKDALHAPHRGILHCTGLLLSVSLALFPFRPHWTLLLTLAFIPHHLRDATRRGIYLYPPLVHTQPVSKNIVRFLLPAFPWMVLFIRDSLLQKSKSPYRFDATVV